VNCYITREMSESALQNMQGFYCKLSSLYNQYDIVVEGDIGRRNMLMSSLQEKMFAEQIRKVYKTAYSNGKTGEPDIVIPEIDSELECKLTSKNKSGSWQLQTDYGTLAKKGKLDYLYVLASRDFSEFAVLFFKGLTCEDFKFPAPGSRGKARMKFSHALKKCTPLYGDVLDKSLKYMADAEMTLRTTGATKAELDKAQKRLKHWKDTTSISFILETT